MSIYLHLSCRRLRQEAVLRRLVHTLGEEIAYVQFPSTEVELSPPPLLCDPLIWRMDLASQRALSCTCRAFLVFLRRVWSTRTLTLRASDATIPNAIFVARRKFQHLKMGEHVVSLKCLPMCFQVSDAHPTELCLFVGAVLATSKCLVKCQFGESRLLQFVNRHGAGGQGENVRFTPNDVAILGFAASLHTHDFTNLTIRFLDLFSTSIHVSTHLCILKKQRRVCRML